MDTLTNVMMAFKSASQNGLTAVKPMAMGLFGSLLVLDFTWAVIKMMLDGSGNYLKLITEKLVRYGIFFLFLTNYENIFKQVIDSFITVGLAAGENKLTATTFANPSELIFRGFTTVAPLKEMILKTLGLETIGMLLLLSVVYFLIIIAYFIMAIQVFITYLEMYVVGTLAIIFVGCGVNKQTSFLAEKAFGAIISFGVKLMVLACILSMSEPILTTIVLPAANDKNLLEIYLSLLVGVAAIAFFTWQSPAIAAGLMSGSPSLTAGSVAGAVMAGTAAGIGLAMGGKGLASKIGGMMGGGGSDGGGGGGSGGPDVSSAANTIQAAGKLDGMGSGAGGGDSAGGGGDSLGAGGGNDKAGEGGSPSANGMTAESVKDSVRPEKPGGNAGAGGEGSGASGSSAGSGSAAGGAGSGASASTADSGSTASAGDASVGGGDSPGGGADSSVSAATADSGSAGAEEPSAGGGDSAADGGDSGTSEASAETGGASTGESFTFVGTSSGPSANGMTVEGLKENQTGEKSKSTSSVGSMAGKIALAKQAIPEEASPQGGIHVPITHDN